MIKTCGLTKQFDHFTAVEDVNIDVSAGKVMVLLGPNGAGKTTTVRMLTSILEPTRGDAWVAGYHVVRQARHVRTVVGVLTEHHGLYSRMTAVEYLEFFGSLYGLEKEGNRRRISQLLDEFGLAEFRRQRLGEYSKGMRQKLALVRAMLHDPPVLLLDEPTSAMDPESARTVRNAILSLRSSDRTVILCTHNLAEAEELADLVAIIRRGKIIFNDTLAKLTHRLIGSPEYTARLAVPAGGSTLALPAGAVLTGMSDKWLRFQVTSPEVTNPVLLTRLVEQGIQIISFQAETLSLEQAYLNTIRGVESQ
jgi:ABC-2 type transport system ATP-binding protein